MCTRKFHLRVIRNVMNFSNLKELAESKMNDEIENKSTCTTCMRVHVFIPYLYILQGLHYCTVDCSALATENCQTAKPQLDCNTRTF